MKRLRQWFLLGLLLLIAMPAACVYWMLATEQGSRFALGLGLTALPSTIDVHFEQFEGRLLDRMTLTGLRISDTSLTLRITRIDLDWRPFGLLGRQLRIRNINVSGVDYVAAVESGQSTPWSGLSLPIAIDIGQGRLEQLQANMGGEPLRIPRASLSARLAGSSFTLRELTLALQAPSVEITAASGVAKLSTELPFRISVAWRGDLPDLGPSEGHGNLSGDLARLEIEHRLLAPLSLDVVGSVELQEDPVVALLATWPSLRWPVAGSADFAVAEGEMKLNGPVSAYTATLRTGLRQPQWLAGGLTADARGDDKGLTRFNATLSALEGRVDVVGDLGWQGVPQINADLEARGISPAHGGQGVAGRLDFDLGANVRFTDAGPVGQVNLSDLSGVLAQQPVSGQGELRLSGDRFEIERLHLENGRNSIDAQGMVGGQLTLSGSASMTGLEQYHPDLRGTLEATWSASGPTADPAVEARIDGRALAWAELALRDLRAVVAWPGLDAGRPFELEIEANGLTSGGLGFEQFRLKSEGEPAAHQIALDLTHSSLNASLAASGGWREGRWQGVLEKLRIAEPEYSGIWGLRSEVPLQIGSDVVNLQERLCLDQAGSSACVLARWSAGDGVDIDARVDELPLNWFNVVLPEGWATRGRLAAELIVKGDAQLQGKLDASIPELLVETAFMDSEKPIELENIVLRSELAESGVLITTAGVDVRGHGGLQGRLSAMPAASDLYQLQGKVSGTLTDMSAFTAVSETVSLTGGRLTMDIGLGGTNTRPSVSGDARLDRLDIAVPELGVEFNDVAFDIRAVTEDRLALTGSLQAETGQLGLAGEWSLDAANGYPVELDIKGADALVMRLPEAEVYVSPDLQLEGNAVAGYQVRGELVVPKARFEIRELPADVVSVSRDQQIVGETSDPQRQVTQSDRFDTNIVLRLGDAVSLSGFGLETDLTGALKLQAKPGKEPQGYGDIELLNGSYQAYGQDLTIDKGRLVFAGPLADPGIDLRAFRKSNDERVTAWLQVTALASAPRLRVYSDPELPETEALSYLLTGKGMQQSGGADKSRIYAAALNWGVGQGEPLFAQLQEQFGLAELSFEGGETIEESGVRVGKYLNPNLYIGYGLGLFTRSSELLLRYSLTENLSVESRSGDTQSADVFFQIERD